MVFKYFCSFCAFLLSRYCPWKHHIFKFWWSITDRGLLLLVLQVSKMCLFASKSFTACFYARVLDCFGADFCTWREGEVRPPPFARAHPAVPAPRAETTILPSSGCLRIAVGNRFIADVRGLFTSSIPLIYMSILTPVSRDLELLSFCSKFWNRDVWVL